jgi:L,D-peptidoglycan transpeptidase YkuD (ErfK/YbiS/YcfS/YnhG family)
LHLDNTIKQKIVVIASSWGSIHGNLTCYERSTSYQWEVVSPSIPVVLGKKGLAWGMDISSTPDLPSQKIEGDLKSPAGVFSLGAAFGLLPLLSLSPLKWDYIELNSHIEAIDDPQSIYYNQIIDRRSVPTIDWKSSERMGLEPLYQLGLIVEYNTLAPISGMGSAIFMHVWKDSETGTAGCTAMSYENLERILKWLDPVKNPRLIQYPQELLSSWEIDLFD